MIIELLQDHKIITTIDTDTPELDFLIYKEMQPNLTRWRVWVEPLDELKARKTKEIQSAFEYEAEYTANTTVKALDNFAVDARRKDMINIGGLIKIYTEPISFVGLNEIRANTTLDDLNKIEAAIIVNGNDRYHRKWLLLKQINDATESERNELEQITW